MLFFLPPPPPVHPDTVLKEMSPAVHYILPCTWFCSCDTNKIYKGWMAEINGRVYHIEGARIDGVKAPEFVFDPNTETTNSKK